MPEKIDARMLRAMFLSGTKYLENEKEWINELNVFPVPDGDTGTNMTLTLTGAAVNMLNNEKPDSIQDICRIISAGTLKNARGNSGVIMSQLCRGFTKRVENEQDIDKEILADAFDNASKAAYRAVMKPKEGTILTVARAAADKAKELADDEDISMQDFLQNIIAEAKTTLAKTPDMLPVLKEAGVVDSGGQGLVEFMNGAYKAYTDAGISEDITVPEFSAVSVPQHADSPRNAAGSQKVNRIDTSNIETADIKFIYCTEFIIEMEKDVQEDDETGLRNYLASIGDSIVCVGMDNIIKVHVHTNHPGLAIEKALELGQLSSLKIDNMRIEHNERITRELKEYGIITVCTGDGLSDVFTSLGTDVVIQGGQTMNPSTDDFLDAIAKVNARNIFILPNNSNIILAANQAKEMTRLKNIYVIPSRNVCEGISAVINFAPEMTPEENVPVMTDALQLVKCAEVTYAIRSSHIFDKDIEKGDYMGLSGNKILAVSRDADEAAVNTAINLADEDTVLITIYYGEDINEEQAEQVARTIEQHTGAETSAVYGGQNVYSYIISAE